MAAIDTTRPMKADRPTLGFFGVVAMSVLDWNDRRATRKALSKLTDRELNDIGLTRGDVVRLG